MENIKKSNKLLAGVALLIVALAISFVAVVSSNNNLADAKGSGQGGVPGRDVKTEVTGIVPATATVTEKVSEKQASTAVVGQNEEVQMNLAFDISDDCEQFTFTITANAGPAAKGMVMKLFFEGEGFSCPESVTFDANGQATVTLTRIKSLQASSNGTSVIVTGVTSKDFPTGKTDGKGTNTGPTSAKTGVF